MRFPKRFSSVLLSLLLVRAALGALPEDGIAHYRTGARWLFDLVNVEAPAGKDDRAAHRAELAASMRDFRTRWMEPAAPFLAQLVPADVPDQVVYPFGGGDLITALLTFPRAREITTLSLEPAGEPVTLNLGPGLMDRELAIMRRDLDLLFRKAHSRTDNLGTLAHLTLPGQLMFSLAALELTGREPVDLKYFRIAPDGTLVYVTIAEVAATRPGTSERAQLFRNMELSFVPKGSPPGTPPVIQRHIAFNLDDEHLAHDPGLLKHLAAKGRVAAMTKAASFLLWSDGFSSIRRYLLEHVAWMISDATGIPPQVARAAGFEQVAYGRFDGPLLGASSRITADVRALFAGARETPVRYGYPDSSGHAHIIVTRPRQRG